LLRLSGEAKETSVAKILLVDDEENIRKVTKGLLAKHGYADVLQAESGRQALEMIRDNEVDLVISDVMMRGMDGLSLFEHVKGTGPVFVLLTAFGTKATALNAIKNGVYDILAKPYEEEEFLTVVSMALKERVLSSQNTAVSPGLEDVFFNSVYPEITVLKEITEKYAALQAPVLLTGEKGTGRELVARVIHGKSQLSLGPFIKMNCAAVPADKFMPELFGANRGEYAGADIYKPGKFELASGGAVFLDDVDKMPQKAQEWLLDFLKEKGNSGDAARVFSAASPEIKQEAASGKFSARLYEELTRCRIALPSLKDRKDDILKFAVYYMKKYSAKYSVKDTALDKGAADFIRQADWPGNIRAIDNMMKKIMKNEKGGLITAEIAVKYHGAAET